MVRLSFKKTAVLKKYYIDHKRHVHTFNVHYYTLSQNNIFVYKTRVGTKIYHCSHEIGTEYSILLMFRHPIPIYFSQCSLVTTFVMWSVLSHDGILFLP